MSYIQTYHAQNRKKNWLVTNDVFDFNEYKYD